MMFTVAEPQSVHLVQPNGSNTVSTTQSDAPRTSAALLAVEVAEDEVEKALAPTLIVSPYTEQAHLLDLNSLTLSCQLMARALTMMDAVRPDYATALYTEAFNWPIIFKKLQTLVQAEHFDWQTQSFYIVVFHSQIPPSTSREHLGGLDARSHAEAMASGGLLKYWFGRPDDQGRNLATCIWRDIKDAKKGGSGPGHRQAAKETRALYTDWRIERLQITISDKASSWEISDWVG